MSTLQKVYSSLRKEPLFLPRGSIRAIIALAVVGTWIGLLFLGRDVSKEFYVILGAVITFYFQARENDKERELEAKKSEDVLAAIGKVVSPGASPGEGEG